MYKILVEALVVFSIGPILGVISMLLSIRQEAAYRKFIEEAGKVSQSSKP